MKRKAQDTIVKVFLSITFALAATAVAQSTNNAFKQAVTEYQQHSTSENAAKVIKLALGMKPAPAIPEEAERFIARGQAAVESAKEPADFKAAAAEFEKAVLSAPWVANAYYNLGLVQDKAGDYAGAIRNLNLYLLAAPNADDTRAVKSLIYKIEFKQEKAAKDVRVKEAAAAQEARRPKTDEELIRSLNGARYVGNHVQDRLAGEWDNALEIRGNQMISSVISNGEFKESFNGTMPEKSRTPLNGREFNHWMGVGTISEDGATITLRMVNPSNKLVVETYRRIR
ncbi:MAG: hypothetical protein A2107_01485 [Verrucomicrobia bacterium GWF2_62_7]|nr:MAG: hypothetical protein A2107_01485 [Verrucomicrobia bacterium GWF2_62_7]